MEFRDFAGKRALVTGASSGMGAEYARILADAGADLVLTARRVDALDALAAELRASSGVAVDVMAADLSAPDGPGRLMADMARRGLSADILVNNAGYGVYGPFLELADEAERAMIAVDVIALTLLTKEAARPMVERGWGRILQVASVGAFQPVPLYASYSAAKAYVLNYGLAINRELRGTGVTVTVINPGVTRTGFFDAAGQGEKLTAYQKANMMEARAAAMAGLRALHARRPMVTPGLGNKVAAFMTRFAPRTLLASVTMGLMKP